MRMADKADITRAVMEHLSITARNNKTLILGGLTWIYQYGF